MRYMAQLKFYYELVAANRERRKVQKTTTALRLPCNTVNETLLQVVQSEEWKLY
jgi:hypothetical protein